MGVMKHILITGGNGYIAQSIYKELKDVYSIHLLTRQEVDLRNSSEVNAWFADKHFDVVIHTAIVGGHRLKEESYSVIDDNLQMYYNLLSNKNKFDRFINIGSGAELQYTDRPYALSKHIIRKSMSMYDNFYNVRVYATFDENELDTRFIKANIKRYKNKEPMTIHNNIQMDFFYMVDFIKVIGYYIEEASPKKEVDCTYSTSHFLYEIAEIINNQSDYKVSVQINDHETIIPNYIGRYTDIGLDYIGLKQGITSVYNKLCKI
jgi:dTDP-4-dehydrorhamnose reductase